MSTFVRRQEISQLIGAAGRFTLRVTDADVRIIGAAVETAEVVGTFEISAGSEEEASRILEAVKLRVTGSEGQLTVEQAEKSGSGPELLLRLFGGRGGASVEIEATVPSSAAVRVETVSGELDASNLNGDQRYAAVSGDLTLVDGGGTVRLNTVSGDAVLRAEGSLALRAETVSGDLNLSAARLEELRATTVSGDVDIEGALRRGGEFRIETVSGDVSFAPIGAATFEVRGLSTDVSSDVEHRIEGRADRRRLIVGDGGPELIFSSMSGDFHVRRPRRAEPDIVSAVSAGSGGSARREETTAGQADELEVLRALERGEIDVEEAARRLGRG